MMKKNPGLPIPVILATLLIATVGHAKLVFEETQVEKHATLLDEKAEAVFRFTNEGDQTVRVIKVQSSCGCTVPQLAKKEYAPGESGEITALFTFGSRQGRQQKRITVVTDEADQSFTTLDFITHIPRWGEARPRLLRWIMGAEAEPKEARLTLESPDLITVEYPEELKNFTLEVEELRPGYLRCRVLPKTTDKRVTERISFKLTARKGDLSRSRELTLHALVR